MTLTTRSAAFWLAIFVGAAYAGGLTGPYHFDDSHSVESNLAVRSLGNIPSFWLDPMTSSALPENRVYRPLVYTFYSVCWLVGGGLTWPFHMMKMAMHLLVALALFLIWKRLWSEPGWFPTKGLRIKLPFLAPTFPLDPAWAAFFLASLFAVHPATAECVDYISATTSLQCALFYVWAFYSWLRYREKGERRFLWHALGLYFLSVASKEEGITLPAMILFTDWLLGKPLEEAIKKVTPFALLGLVLAAWIFYFHPTEGNISRGVVSSEHYFMTQWRAYLWYMRLWFWPWDLNADYAEMKFSTAFEDPLVIQAAIGNLLLLGIAWAKRKRFPSLFFGVVWFYVTISPASSVVVLAEAINEHRMYLAYIGFVGGTFAILLACAESFFEAEGRAWRLGWVYAAVFVGLFIGTQERNRVWRTAEALWSDTVEKNPTSGRALNNLALVYMARGEYDRAVGLLETCERHWTSYSYCPLNRGISLMATSRHDDAEKAFHRAEQLNPTSTAVLLHLGTFYADVKKDWARAVSYLEKADSHTGGRHLEAKLKHAEVASAQSDFIKARKLLEEARALDPRNESTLFQLAFTIEKMGLGEEAVEAYRELVQLHPRNVKGWYNLGVALLTLKKSADARKAFLETVELDPKSEQGWFNLAYAAELENDGKQALEALHTLTSLKPDDGTYKSRLEELVRKFTSVQGAH